MREWESESMSFVWYFIIINEIASNVDWKSENLLSDYFLYISSTTTSFLLLYGIRSSNCCLNIFETIFFDWLTQMIKFTMIDNNLFFIKIWDIFPLNRPPPTEIGTQTEQISSNIEIRISIRIGQLGTYNL